MQPDAMGAAGGSFDPVAMRDYLWCGSVLKTCSSYSDVKIYVVST